MKKLFSIAFVAMLFVQNAKAQEVVEVENSNPSVIATPYYYAKFNGREDTFKMRVLLSKRDGDVSVLHLKVLDKDGHELYSKYLDKKEKQAMVDFNMEDLADGIYTFELSNKYGTTSKKYVKETEKEPIKYTKQLIALN
jgi:hypothetical protein